MSGNFYNGSERTDYAEFQEETQNDRASTVADPTTGTHVGPAATAVETDEEGYARVHGKQEVPDELRGFATATDTPLPDPEAVDAAQAAASEPGVQ